MNKMKLPGSDLIHNDGLENGIYCRRCGYGGCDVRLVNCGCSFHARCIDVSNPPLSKCPCCNSQVTSLTLYSMSFHELDNAKRTAAAQSKAKRSKKRKNPPENNATVPSADGTDNDCRTGRWTPEEMALCDSLIDRFKAGDLPIQNGVKLNDFLATMLNSKQSRLTKKMKNANLSGKQFLKTNGFIADIDKCKHFSEVEDAFFRSINDPLEQASMRFHMQKEWRELFSNFCVNLGQPLDIDSWISSVEEMERRESVIKEAARMKKRKMMMGMALDKDVQNPDNGVFIDRSKSQNAASHSVIDNFHFEQEELLNLLADKPVKGGTKASLIAGERHYWHFASPFLGKIINYIQRHNCPFEHIDAWVPSFVPDSEATEGSGAGNRNGDCRLCFGGTATAEVVVPPNRVGESLALSQDEQYNLLSFGDYSQKFSFNLGCGLPGRVYESGVPAWEQSVHHAPHHHFERCGGASQWGIKTVLGVPVPSPTVGRIVVVLYSMHDRVKDKELVGRFYDEFKKFVPTPKWKLVVDIGMSNENRVNNTSSAGPMVARAPLADTNRSISEDSAHGQDTPLIDEVIKLLGDNMPYDQNSPLHIHFPSVMALRLMLLKRYPTPAELEQQTTLLSSYQSYKSSGRTNSEVAIMVARDYMFLKQQSPSEKNQPSLRHGNVGPSMDQLNVAISNAVNNNNLIASKALYSANGLHLGQIQQNLPALFSLQQNHFLHPSKQLPQVSNHSHLNLQHQQANSLEASNNSHASSQLQQHQGNSLRVLNHSHLPSQQSLQQQDNTLDVSSHSHHVNLLHHSQQQQHEDETTNHNPIKLNPKGNTLDLSSHSQHSDYRPYLLHHNKQPQDKSIGKRNKHSYTNLEDNGYSETASNHSQHVNVQHYHQWHHDKQQDNSIGLFNHSHHVIFQQQNNEEEQQDTSAVFNNSRTSNSQIPRQQI